MLFNYHQVRASTVSNLNFTSKKIMFTFYSNSHSFPIFFLTMYLLHSYMLVVGLRRDQFRFGECDRREHLSWPQANEVAQE
jgi:hypothetical protein